MHCAMAHRLCLLPQAMARRSDGPWVLRNNMMMRNNSNERDNSSFGGNAPHASRGGDIFDMKGYLVVL